ncbi:MAG: UbiX family flavin prenyltransferase [Kiloniellales bacterium]|nr:UbiX family flavin prenyltransferase [Kiloniellales bacterium]
MTEARKQRIIVAISGATGIVYSLSLLNILRTLGIETHLVISKAGEQTRSLETDVSASQLRELADYHHAIQDIAAPISSGSFRTMGMIVVPCSMRSLGEIASGATGNLLTRAADVVLKEGRKLVLVVRETPLSNIHLRNMLTVSECGGVIFPPVVSFYTKPKSIDDIINQTIARILDQFELDAPGVVRWGEDQPESATVSASANERLASATK